MWKDWWRLFDSLDSIIFLSLMIPNSKVTWESLFPSTKKRGRIEICVSKGIFYIFDFENKCFCSLDFHFDSFILSYYFLLFMLCQLPFRHSFECQEKSSHDHHKQSIKNRKIPRIQWIFSGMLWTAAFLRDLLVLRRQRRNNSGRFCATTIYKFCRHCEYKWCNVCSIPMCYSVVLYTIAFNE